MHARERVRAPLTARCLPMPARCRRPHTPLAHSRRSLSPASQPDAFPPGVQAHSHIHAPPCREGTRVTAAPLAAERLTADLPLYTPPSSATRVSESSTRYLKPLQAGVSTQRVPPVRAARSTRQAPRDRVPRIRYSVPLGAAGSAAVLAMLCRADWLDIGPPHAGAVYGVRQVYGARPHDWSWRGAARWVPCRG